MAFTPSHEDLRSAVDASIGAFLAERRADLADATPLIDEIARIVGSGGKRLRPSFCYWGFRAAAGAHDDRAIHAAAALELLHTFAIVHDDIMDGSDERRGEPTSHRMHGVPIALLVGDLALVLADDALLSCGFPPDKVAAAFEVYTRMRREVIAGQFLDVEADETTTPDRAHRIAALKSGRYSVREPLVIGAVLGGAGDELLEGLATFGEPAGVAFQFQDDLLGTFGDRAVTGKPTDSDMREGKRNLLYATAAARLEGDDRGFFTSRWGAGESLTPAEVDRLRTALEISGAKAEVERVLEELRGAAAARLAALPIDAESMQALGDLLDASTARTA